MLTLDIPKGLTFPASALTFTGKEASVSWVNPRRVSLTNQVTGSETRLHPSRARKNIKNMCGFESSVIMA